jgi:hypothetical protein
MLPRSGDVLLVGRAASVQFATPILFRVIRAFDRETYVGWIWLDGYELNAAGDAAARREIFVQAAGLTSVGSSADSRTSLPAAGPPTHPAGEEQAMSRPRWSPRA